MAYVCLKRRKKTGSSIYGGRNSKLTKRCIIHYTMYGRTLVETRERGCSTWKILTNKHKSDNVIHTSLIMATP